MLSGISSSDRPTLAAVSGSLSQSSFEAISTLVLLFPLVKVVGIVRM
jgi:hypothetical protein